MLLLTDLPVPGVMQLASPDPETPIIFTDKVHKTFSRSDQSERAKRNRFKSLNTSASGHNSPHSAIFIHII